MLDRSSGAISHQHLGSDGSLDRGEMVGLSLGRMRAVLGMGTSRRLSAYGLLMLMMLVNDEILVDDKG